MIRRYSQNDRSKLIELLRQNTPQYFDFSEEMEFKKYLDDDLEDYFVYEEHSEIIGCGGINYFPKQKLARISWDIIAPNSQGKGIGQQLMQHRLQLIRGNRKIETISVRTSQFTFGFYEKMGFELEAVTPQFWSENFDLYQLQMPNKGPS